ncbi:MAG: sigma-70 family RNA polymerase sigma factor [Planctomycetota bacterium]
MADTEVSRRQPRAHPELTTAYVRRAVEGDSESIEWIVRRFSKALTAQAHHRLRRGALRTHSADDLVQDTWRLALPKLAHFEPSGPRYAPALIGYLSKTLQNHYFSQLKKQINEDTHSEAAPGPDNESGVPELADEAESIVAGAIRSENALALLDAIDRLPEREAQIVMLRGIEMIPNHEVAHRLGLAANTTAVCYRRALGKLRALLPGTVVEDFED